MTLALGSAELVEDMERTIGKELSAADSGMIKYLARLFATAPLASLETIKWNWVGLRMECAEDRERDFRLKLHHSRQMGDNSLVYCTFYKEETDGRSGRPGLELASLGRAGYNAAGLYASMLNEENAAIYPQLSHILPTVIVRVSPRILRNYLGDINPPQRVIFYTPRGEIILRLRNSRN